MLNKKNQCRKKRKKASQNKNSPSAYQKKGRAQFSPGNHILQAFGNSVLNSSCLGGALYLILVFLLPSFAKNLWLTIGVTMACTGILSFAILLLLPLFSSGVIGKVKVKRGSDTRYSYCEWAKNACSQQMTTFILIKDVSKAISALEQELEHRHPYISQQQITDYIQSQLVLVCEGCEQILQKDAVSLLCMNDVFKMSKGVMFGGGGAIRYSFHWKMPWVWA